MITLNLLENSIDYFNQSLHNVIEAQKANELIFWKYANLHVIQAIELILKEKLRLTSEILIYEDIDKFRETNNKTVNFSSSIERLKYILGKNFIKLDSGRLLQAMNYRNCSLHYNFKMEFPKAYEDYCNFFGFYCDFYNRYIKRHYKKELYEKINKEYLKEYQIESINFKEKIVVYNNVLMPIYLKIEIENQQRIEYFMDEKAVKYKRIPYGDEIKYFEFNKNDEYYFTYANKPCHDCFVSRGQFHLDGCDVEICPKCKSQLLSCGCFTQKTDDED
jgi:HEPN domain-containing protein